MQTAVWDTYVKKKNGNIMHFDIIVPDTIKDTEAIYSYGKAYLAQTGESESSLDTEECRFCHIEEPTPEIKEAIKTLGYFILEMSEIPAKLPVNATRRDLILYLRGHYKQYRFVDLKEIATEELYKLLS